MEILIVVLLVSGVVFPFLYFSSQRKNRNIEKFIQQQRKKYNFCTGVKRGARGSES